MEEAKQDIRGDFNGQLANGNINNYNYQDREKLSEADAYPIGKKVQELLKLTGREQPAVWGELKRIFGAGYKDLYKDQLLAAHAILDGWIMQAKNEDAVRNCQLKHEVDARKAQIDLREAQQRLATVQQRLDAAHTLASDTRIRHQQEKAECDTRVKVARNALLRWKSGMSALLLLALLASAAVAVMYGLYSHKSAQAESLALQLAAKPVPSPQCMHESLTYGLGSVLDRKGTPDWRCVVKDGQASWEEVKLKTKRK
ncbi:hypothetical protein [Leeia aquatica]|uniref:Uncharacterized protein n=1 Tax=Leeia aquatica TaxID=2725557 RepID=A0A847S894_9NEIS|nr:hypothetical protein [Leeia aquatica]NLR73559.1 hypothetical protein [Leeia aquatica]